MSTLTFTNDPREIAGILENLERKRLGLRLDEARRTVARRVGCAPGTLENLRKGRLKRLEGWLQQKLETLLVKEIEAEIRRLAHELEAYQATGRNPAEAPQFARLVETVRQAQLLIEAAQ